MKVVFDHIDGWGKVSDQDVIVSYPHGLLEEGDNVSEILAKGWIPWDGKWYNMRSVRINLNKYAPSKTTRRISHKIDYNILDCNGVSNIEDYRKIYEKYCFYRGFKRTIAWEQIFTGSVISYLHATRLIGYSCIDIYGSDMVATQFVWDYEDPSLSLGKVAQMFECETAKQKGCTYVYILGGYESCCLYKSDYRGMEWWTGSRWSDDKHLYKQLCLRDDNITLSCDL